MVEKVLQWLLASVMLKLMSSTVFLLLAYLLNLISNGLHIFCQITAYGSLEFLAWPLDPKDELLPIILQDSAQMEWLLGRYTMQQLLATHASARFHQRLKRSFNFSCLYHER